METVRTKAREGWSGGTGVSEFTYQLAGNHNKIESRMGRKDRRITKRHARTPTGTARNASKGLARGGICCVRLKASEDIVMILREEFCKSTGSSCYEANWRREGERRTTSRAASLQRGGWGGRILPHRAQPLKVIKLAFLSCDALLLCTWQAAQLSFCTRILFVVH